MAPRLVKMGITIFPPSCSKPKLHPWDVVLLVGVLLFCETGCVETYHTKGCSFCDSGKYITRNCTEIAGSLHGIQCRDCSKCKGEGQKIIENCTRYTDSVCGCKDGYLKSGSDCKKVTSTTSMPSTPSVTKITSTQNLPVWPPWLAAVFGFLVFIFIVLAACVLLRASVCLKSGNGWLRIRTKMNSTGVVHV